MVGLEDVNGYVALNMQEGFVTHFIVPLWETVSRILPEMKHFAANAIMNAQRYSDRKEAALAAKNAKDKAEDPNAEP